MPITNNKEIQQTAQRGKYAVGAFNTSNLEITQAILEAAEEKKSPVIIATSQSAIKYAGIDTLYQIFKTLAEKVSIPVSLHLDHGTDFDIIISYIRNGWTSIMYDGSHEPFEKNVENTRKIVEIAHSVGISVEAELGRLVGVEDEISVSEKEGAFTDPDEAVQFVEKTGCDTLAIAIGTSHGAYKFKGEPKLDFDRLKEIKTKVNIPLVLHGASSVIPEVLSRARNYGAELKDAKGVPAEDIRTAVSLGITKVNIDTDLRLAFTASIREFLTEKPEVFDPRKILSAGKKGMKDVISKKIELLGSEGKA
ncbi:class II fructose-1,6-bisphosphate aldolase [candidate division KSB1 bacterium]|nr:MAG: class II fructose-1,6-bisphosphate aldolase [candidate division KSB1 bacterium]